MSEAHMWFFLEFLCDEHPDLLKYCYVKICELYKNICFSRFSFLFNSKKNELRSIS